ncbi:Glutamyl-tRNAGln amidotransferase subunit A, mitochondrial [Hondaea fermentalgiana]|uniref:Glutamyl-tRNAGln amidotransferase subunit A, mitochondrial n=1 Tax=Hondaea fermentalgiana TaxID=2315210 RepID=A0A2R5GVI2_9STRA|nr:Glutamyl-tRNAGln amidotransferase subunit A, mitochondrial [Hondaea fermentalgiana]|eukprot:GBG32663.1 Glutamyl-tRNAGln amidotransferase subunit A, mitochondrial [Hondaea fermentalgiana]
MQMAWVPSAGEVLEVVHAAEIYLLATCVVVSLLLLKRARDSTRQRRTHAKLVEAIGSADPRLAWSTLTLAQKLREGEVTSYEMVELYISQLERVDVHLHAVVGNCFKDALRDAKDADDLLAEARRKGSTDSLPDFLGVPFISKEVFEYPGFPFTGGIVGRREVRGRARNPVLQRLQDEGAIILACGNTSEACMWSESSNPVHGRTCMPYDLRRTCGGSSGGTAALVSALGGSFGVTSDVGGSTRIPALYNGLFGHKPTGGAVPNTRCIPKVHGLVERYCQLGPTARYAHDLFPLLETMAGRLKLEDLEDATEEELEHLEAQRKYMLDMQWPHPATVRMRELKYYVVWDQPGSSMGITRARDPEMLAAQRRVVRALETSLGVKVHAVEFDALKRCFDLWSAMLLEAQTVPFAEIMSEGLGSVIWPVWELVKSVLTFGYGSQHTLPALGLACTERFRHLTPRMHRNNLELGEELRLEMNDLLGEDGVLIFPGLPTPAPLHGPLPNLLYFADFGATGIFNVLELPATAVPTGLSRDKKLLPTGVQLVAANGNDHLTIATAMHLESLGVAGWVPPLAATPR